MSFTIPLQGEDIARLLNSIGNVDDLQTNAKGTLVEALNELFTSAGNGKALLAAAITGRGVDTAATDSFATMAANVGLIKGGLERLVRNDENIVPTGEYADSTYYNLDYGVAVGYCPDGSVLISMKGGTLTTYENLNFTLASAPDGVSIQTSSTSWDTSDPAGNLYVCRLTGIAAPVDISIAMDARNGTYDYVTCAITVTEV